MKRIIFLSLFIAPLLSFAQDFESQWKEIDRLIEIKNYRQTTPIIQSIKTQAKATDNSPEWIRAILAEHHAQTVNIDTEQAFYEKEKHLLKHINEANPLEYKILQNLYATFLLNHIYQGHVETADGYLSWDTQRRKNHIDSLFKTSIDDPDLLLSQRIEQWKTLVTDLKNQTLAPTVYHLLVYNYLGLLDGWYSNNDYERSKPIIQALQDINVEKEYKNAYAYLDFRPYAREGAWRINEYEQPILQQLERQHTDYNAHILMLLANAHKSHGENKKAVELLHKTIKEYPNSPWLDDARKLLDELLAVSLSLYNVPNYTPSEQHTPIRVNAQNTDKAFIRVYEVTHTPTNFKESKTTYDSTNYTIRIDAPLVYEEEIALKAFDDYKNHTTNYKINPLPYGSYRMLIANNADFKDDGQELDVSQADFVVSDIFISPGIHEEDDDGHTYQTVLTNRKTGLPYSNKEIVLYADQYQEAKSIAALTTNAHGEFVYISNDEEKKPDLDELYLYLPNENQLIDLDRRNNIPEYIPEEDEDKIENKALLFTDRSIYRPGQEVFFKAIVYHKDQLRGKITANSAIKVILKDANYQDIDTIRLTSNSFGSAHGSFRIPHRTLNGQFQMEVYEDTGDHLASYSFSVEEYKRPTFKVIFDENKSTYTKQDTAVFTGTVESLSGAKLSHIPVKYTVSFYAQGKYYQRVNYLDETATTDHDGKFSFQIPFRDTIFRNQTDINLQFEAEAINETGEIQTTSGSYRYADNPLRISVASQSQISEEDWDNIIIKTMNPNGHPLAAKGSVNIYKYAEPNIVQADRKTFDFQTEYHILDTTEYESYFPWYFDRLDVLDERPKTLVGSYKFDSTDIDTVGFDGTMYPYGSYQVEALVVTNGDTTRSEQMVQVLAKDTHKISDKDFLNIRLDQEHYTIGEQMTVHFQTDIDYAGGAYLWKRQDGAKDPVVFLPFQEDGHATFTHTVSEQDILHSTWFEVMMIQENKIATVNVNIPIVRTDNQLQIQTRTVRDKITPGQKETWSFTIKNKDNDVQSEVLASMYDTALDQFRQHSFPSTFMNEPPRHWHVARSRWNRNLDYFYDSTQSHTLFRKVFGIQYEQIPPVIKNYGLFGRGLLHFPSSRVFHSVGLESATMDEVIVTTNFGSKRIEGAITGTTQEIEEPPNQLTLRGVAPSSSLSNTPLYIVDGEIMDFFDSNQINQDDIHEMSLLNDAQATALYGSRAANGVVLITTKKGHKLEQLNQVQARANLQETAFFYPNLLTDKDGNLTFEFESPEALTRWKLMLFAHTKDLKAGTASFFTQTQKQLMVQPNLPRFLREGDEIVVKSQIQNLSDDLLNGTARLEIINPETNDIISTSFFEDKGLRDFAVNAKENTVVSWILHIPQGYPTVQIRVVGATEEFSDGELHELAILPNRILVTDTEKIILDAGQRKDYPIPTAGKDNLQLNVQVQSNPILEIISALDYLKNYPHECSEQMASKWYSFMMLQYMQKHYPAITAFFNNIDPDNTRSRLEENSSLSELLNEEMPWVRQIQNDKERIQSLAKLFRSDLASDIDGLEQKLQKNQMENGGFAWFDGGKTNTHISIRLLEIFGKVAKLDESLLSEDIRAVSRNIMSFLDNDTTIYGANASTGLVLDYLYARTLWNNESVLPAQKTEQLRKHIDLSASYTAKQPAGLAAKAWLVNALYDYRIASIEVKNRIEQEVIYDKNRGMYWESNERPYNSMSLQSYLVEAYQELDPNKLDQVTQWIYWRRQHHNWLTTWNTVDAVYALLLANNPEDFKLDNTVTIHINQELAETNAEVLGQVNVAFEKLEIDKTISVKNNNNRKIYGGIYHQYFVPLEAVSSTQKDLSVEKKFLIEKEGKWIESTSFQSGDKIKVRLIVVSNEDLNYVHLKDGRAAGFEPVYQPSGYTWWQGYYFTIKDASTNYFFDYLPKGRHVYEYEVKTNNNGVFNSGIAQIECMYEPAINARSENIKVTIEE